MLRLEFDVEGEKELHRIMERIPTKTQNWMGPFTETGRYLQGFFSGEVFSTEGSVIGEPWKPLAESTKKQKARKNQPMKPLVATGKMKESFTSTATPRTVQVYNTTDYFKYHQSNKPRSGNLPRRVMMKLDEMRKQIIIKKFHEEFMRRINRI